ncbi:MAG: hypothetical protein ABI972_12990 [Acidobacteriota bacterium]
MPIDFAAARHIARGEVADRSGEAGLEAVLLEDLTLERDFGWVFFYGPKDISLTIAGNAPFIVDRSDGSIHTTGTAYPTKLYLDSYARVRRPYPFAVPDHIVVLAHSRPGLLKISLTKAIRHATGKGLAEAKNCTDSLLAGRHVDISFASAQDAEKFRAQAESLGALTRSETRYH